MNISSKDFTPEESYAYEMGYKDALKEISIPMKMIEENWNPSKCPRCHHSFEEFEPCDDGYYDRATNLERCPYCGQKIFWQ